jgi:hypothetical protein
MREQRTPARDQLAKIPEPRTPRANTTVAELAAELGRTLRAMYDLCNAQQVYARGPDCEISPSNANRLREAHNDRVRRMELLRDIEQRDDFASAARRAATRSPFDQLNDDPEVATIARNLGVRPSDRKRARPRTPAEPRLSGTAAEAARQWEGISRERAKQIADLWTVGHLFAPAAAAEWWSSGLRSDDAELAAVLRGLGIQPEHMRLSSRGETIRYRLIEQRVAPEHIARILRQAGHL